MKALFTIKPAITKQSAIAATALISLISVLYPNVSAAAFSLQAEGQNTTALVFDIKNTTQTKTQSSLTIDSIVSNDPLPKLVQKYLEDRNSPLSIYAEDMVILPNWKKALAISFVESNMGLRCADNNCSGIGVKPGHPLWRKYQTKLDWFVDLNNLLSKPIYSEKYDTFRKMKGVYVQPGSEGWVKGAEKIYGELTELEEQAEHMRSLAANGNQVALANTSNMLSVK